MAEGWDLDDKFEALEEFVMEALSDFNKRLQNIEKGIRETISEEMSDFKANTSTEIKESVSITVQTEIDKLKEEINGKIPEDLSDFKQNMSMEIQESVYTEMVKAKEEMQQKMDDESCVEIVQKNFNPVMSQYMNEPKSSTPKMVILPTKICDLKNESLKLALASFEKSVKYNKEREKIKPVQLYFIHYWMSKNKGATGRVEDADKLFSEGIKEGIWPKNWKPEGAVTTMRNYLTDKIKGINRRQKIEKQKKEYKEQLNYNS